MDISYYKKNKIKVLYRTTPLNLFELVDTKNMKKWMRRYFKDTPREKHKQIIEEAEAIRTKLNTEWKTIIQSTLTRLSLNPDILGSNVLQYVIKRKFPNEEKNRLRAISRERLKLSLISLGHELMLPKHYQK